MASALPGGDPDLAQDQQNFPDITFVPPPPDPGAQPAPATALPDDQYRMANGQPAVPPSIPRNSQGQPYSPSLSEQTPQQRANVDAAMRSIKSGQATGFASPTGSAGVPPAITQPEPAHLEPITPADPRPWGWVQQNRPDLARTIQSASQWSGVPAPFLASQIATESNFRQYDGKGNVLSSPKGALGLGQLLPSTAHAMSTKYFRGMADPADPIQNVYLTAAYDKDLASVHGYRMASPSMAAAYNAGPNGHFDNPETQTYVHKIFGVGDLKLANANSSMTPQGLVAAGSQGTPDTFLRYIVDSAPRGASLSDAWRQAEGLLVDVMIRRGDIAGAQHAQDFVMQQAYVGTNQNLMAAYQALSRGDGVRASQYLAKAHAFAPDGTIGRFRSDGQNVYGEMLDEHTLKPIGPAGQITPNDIAGLLNQTTDPQKFLATISATQLNAAKARFYQQHGDYYANLPFERQTIANQRAAVSIANSERTNQTRLEAANIRANATQQGMQNRQQQQISKETGMFFNPASPYYAFDSSTTPLELGRMSSVFADARGMGATSGEALGVTKGLHDKTLSLIFMHNSGRYGVVPTGSNDQRPIAYLSKHMGDQLAPHPTAEAPQIGRQGAVMGAVMGMQTDLAGTHRREQTGAQ